MSRRKLLPVIVVPVVMLLLGALFSGPGNAGTAQPEVPWPGPYVCAEGTLAAVTSLDSPNAGLTVEIQPCADADPERVAAARWGVAFYRDGGAQISARTGTFGYLPDGPTTRTGWFLAPGDLQSESLGWLRAACLLIGQQFRLACVRIDLVDGVVQVTPLPITDPLVVRKVRVTDPDTPNPICAGCV